MDPMVPRDPGNRLYVDFQKLPSGSLSMSVCRLSACLRVVSGLNCLRDLGLSSIQDVTDVAFSEPCSKGAILV